MTLFRNSSPNKDLESWLRNEYQRMVLSGESLDSDFSDCPSEEFLHELAKNPSRIRLDDHRLQHASTCSRCMQKFLELREKSKRRKQKAYIQLGAFAAIAVIVATLLFAVVWDKPSEKATDQAAESRTIDLTAAGTLRGSEDPLPLKSVALPKGLVLLTLVLPRFSEAGTYTVAVSRGKKEQDIVVQSEGLATNDSSGTRVTVSLDLRKLEPGSYFLATTHDRDGAYYYPLAIR